MNKKEKMYQKIEQHGADLNAIFHTEFDNITLCKKLRRLETKAHQLSTDYCNGDINSCEEWEKQSRTVLKKVAKVLNINNTYPLCPDDYWPISVNGDPRGYALKINDSYMKANNIKLYQDWGGYGILAPNFSE